MHLPRRNVGGCSHPLAFRIALRTSARAMSPSAAAMTAGSSAAHLFLDRVDQVRAPGLGYLGFYGPAIGEGVTELQRVELLGEADAVTHVQAWREVFAEDQRSLIREVGLEAH